MIGTLPIAVLDQGYVRLARTMNYFEGEPHEIDVVNAARASYEKEVTELGKRDIGLIAYLVRHNEDSPFRHSVVSFGIKAPLMVARQWFKYQIGSAHLVEGDSTAWNETSRRYVSSEPVIYIPKQGEWRGAPESGKQGSTGYVSEEIGLAYTEKMMRLASDGIACYEAALRDGIAPEQARLLLPAYGLYVTWRWTVSLLGVLHFLDQRLGEGAQSEIKDYAKAVASIVQELFPNSYTLIQ